jgi:hypothetical protein
MKCPLASYMIWEVSFGGYMKELKWRLSREEEVVVAEHVLSVSIKD